MRLIQVTRRGALAAFVASAAPGQALTWRALGPGLEHARANFTAAIGDGQLHVLRIDPAQYRFRLLTGAVTGSAPRTARQWAREYGLVAAINAGMFHASGLPVGFAKAEGRIIQSRISSDRSVFVFDATQARLLDRACETFDASAHANALQSIRMMSCAGANVWSQQDRRWSTACLAQDSGGRLMFVHARSPLSVHDFIEMLGRWPLDIARAMYLEGGPEATLYFSGGHGIESIERVGSYETGFNENDDNVAAWPLPNILGIAPR